MLLFCFWPCLWHATLPGQGSNPRHRSDNTESLTVRPPGDCTQLLWHWRHHCLDFVIIFPTGSNWKWALFPSLESGLGGLWVWGVHASFDKMEACVKWPWQSPELAELVNQVCSGGPLASTQKFISPRGVFRWPGNLEQSGILDAAVGMLPIQRDFFFFPCGPFMTGNIYNFSFSPDLNSNLIYTLLKTLQSINQFNF